MFVLLYLPAVVSSGAEFAMPVTAGDGPPNQPLDVLLHARPSTLAVPSAVEMRLDASGNGYVQVRAMLTKTTAGLTPEVASVLAFVSTRDTPPVVSAPVTRVTVVR